jgi:hypothetical protein
MSLPRLSDFSLRDRAEASRLFLHASETEFEDLHIESAEAWATLEPTLPFRGLPIYESDGQPASFAEAGQGAGRGAL